MAKRNVYSNIATMFDVSLDEKFKVYEPDLKSVTGWYKFTEDGLMYCANPDSENAVWTAAEEMEKDILSGDVAVLNNWTPNESDIYFYIADNTGTIHKRAYVPTRTADVLNAKFHNCFKSKDVAESQIEFMVKAIFGENNANDSSDESSGDSDSTESADNSDPTVIVN